MAEGPNADHANPNLDVDEDVVEVDLESGPVKAGEAEPLGSDSITKDAHDAQPDGTPFRG